MTRDTYDITVRRASQLSHRLDLFKASTNFRRASQVTRRSSCLPESDLLRGSERTLFGSSLDSTSESVNSSRTNVQTSASCSYTNSRNDINYDDDDEDDDDDDEDDDGDDVGQGADGDGDDGDGDTSSSTKTQEEAEGDRGLWDRNWHYIFLGFGVVFNIRNVTAFPSLVLQHGGGAFLFTYVVLTYTVGVPLIYLEVSLGQYARGGLVKAWGIMPLARGICISSLLLGIVSAAFTTTTPTSWALYYFYRAFIGPGPSTNIESPVPANSTLPTLPTHHNLHHPIHHPTTSSSSNHSTKDTITNKTALQALDDSTAFFYHSTLQVSSTISYFGHIVTHLVIALIILWGLVFIYASLGPRIMGKTSLLFSAVPSVLLFVATVGVCTLTGSVLGIRTLLNPHWQHLNQVETWLDSLELVLTGLGSGTGVMITLSGHCNFHGNTFRHAILVTSMSVAMTILSGCLMMAALGIQSKQSGVAIGNITQIGDVDFGFVLYPAVTSYLSARGFWNGIFYLALVLLGISKTTVLVHTLHQAFLDLARVEEVSTTWKVGTLGALVTLLMSTNVAAVAQNGIYITRLLQQSIPRLATPTICVAQCITIAWGYGARRFAGRVSEMTGKNKSFLWKWLWRWGCPVLLSISVLVVLMKRNGIHYIPTVDSSNGGLRELYWILPMAVILPGVAVSGAGFFRVPGTIKQRLKRLCATPVPWGPGHPEHEPQADLPDYVICHPDPFRPANALAMLTANLYLPNIVNFVNMDKKPSKGADMSPGYLSEIGTMSSSDDEGSIDIPSSRDGIFGRCWATLGCLGHVIGMGNIIRFPYLAYKHGGGSFLIAYISLLLTCGLPLVVIEIAIGQFSSFGPINVWRAVPLFKGLGFCMVGISLVTSVYYGVMTSWAMYYLATTLTSVMPWQTCDNHWNTNSCVVIKHATQECVSDFNNASIVNMTTTTTTTASPLVAVTPTPCDVSVDGCQQPIVSPVVSCYDSNSVNVTNNPDLTTSAAEYFYKAVVDVSSGLEETGELRWQLILCLLMFWVVVGLCLAKGSRSGGKMTYLIVILPVTLFLILLIRCSALPGGKQGLRHLFTPDVSRLTAGHVWRDAASQVFFSLALGTGSLITSSTYNKFNSHIFREAGLVCLIDTCMSVLSSLLMFAVIGAVSFQTRQPLQETFHADPGLPFVLLSHAVLQIPWSLFWAVLIFLAVVLCGVATCSSAVTSAVFAITERTSLRKQRVWLITIIAGGAFFTGVLFTLQGGFYMVELFDLHVSGLPQLMVGGFTLAAFAWVYGSSRLAADMARMTKAPIRWWWRPMWVAVSPGFVAACIVVSLTSFLSYRDNTHIPWWGTAIGVALWFLLCSPVLFGMVHEIFVAKSGNFLMRLRRSCRSRKAWGATASRYHSHIEYFPTVHTNIGIDLNVDGLNTVTDHVEFTTVGVRVPSLSQTTLLPVSPKSPRSKRPMDMRHKAIMNHAYSNPQCNTSSGSLEKIGKKKKPGSRLSLNASAENMTTNSTFNLKKSKKKGASCNASTQTEKRYVGNSKLQRQRSQPYVWVSKPVRVLARSLSWHSMRGKPAILEVTDQKSSCEDVHKKLIGSGRDSISLEHIKYKRGSQGAGSGSLFSLKEEQQDEHDAQTQRRRRIGQSVAPNIGTLMTSLKSNPNTPLLKTAAKSVGTNSNKRKTKDKKSYKSTDPVDAKIIGATSSNIHGRIPIHVNASEQDTTSDFKELTTVEIFKHSKDKSTSSELDIGQASAAASLEYHIAPDSSTRFKTRYSHTTPVSDLSGNNLAETANIEPEREDYSQVPTISTTSVESKPCDFSETYPYYASSYREKMHIHDSGKVKRGGEGSWRNNNDEKIVDQNVVNVGVRPGLQTDSHLNCGGKSLSEECEFGDDRKTIVKDRCMATGSIIMEEEENVDEDDDDDDDNVGKNAVIGNDGGDYTA